jgi:ketosteroid isomerase-like protein
VIRIFAYVLLAVSIALSVSCTGNRDASEDVEVIVEQIRQADQALLQAEEQRDLESAMALVAPHAVFQPPGLPAIAGHEAIRRFYEQQWFTLPFVEIFGKAETIVVAASGDLAYLDGRSHLTLEISGENVTSEGKYLGVWQRIEGHWRLVAMSWTANEPAR